ncbi:MAG: type I restriction-modification system subunit M [Gammaproteobacteria bacterium]|nr:type I restriction-modification system subunit M [Gammaproteobacteria bacterium]
MTNFGEHVGFIWSIAEILRGNYKQSEYGKVVLPFTVLRRLDCVLEPTKDKVLAQLGNLPGSVDHEMRETMLNMAAGHSFHNTSPFTFEKLLDDPDNIAANLNNLINGFSDDAREIFIERFKLPEQVARLDKDNLLYMVVSRFAQADLHPDKVSNIQMGGIFEELIRRFSEQSNETAGEHFTPREVIRLMVNLLFHEDTEALTKKGTIRKLYDPACGTGGMLSVAEEYLRELNPDAHLEVYGQELNDESYATCKSDMMIKGQNAKNIHPGNSFSEDGLPDEEFDYLLSNPPFGVEWKKVESEVKAEASELGYKGRFGAGLPRISDGSLLFVQHMIAKLNTNGDSSRLAVVLNGSPLFTGSAGSGESEIRRWIIENDWLEAIVALPTDMFYNTGIATYIWIITNQKSAERKGKVQLINAVDFHTPMRKSLGSKRKQISAEQVAEITRLFGENKSGERCKIFDNRDFGYQRITVERPLKLNFQASPERLEKLHAAKAFARLNDDQQQAITAAIETLDQDHLYKNRETFIKALKAAFKAAGVEVKTPMLKTVWQALSERDDSADACLIQSGANKGKPEPDTDLRDYENVPLKEEINDYFQREVLPRVPEAWIDHDKTKTGYEIPFNRHFYQYVPPRSLAEIDADLDKVSAEIMQMLRDVHV